MTKKLRKKVKRITLTVTGSLLSITALGAIGTKLLTMPKINLDQVLANSQTYQENARTNRNNHR